jgi:hypothetical protein
MESRATPRLAGVRPNTGPASPKVIGPPGSTFVYAALAFDKVGKPFGVGLKLLGISKYPRPFAPGLCIYDTRIGCAKNNNAKRLDISNPFCLPRRLKRLMRTRLGPMLFSPPTDYFEYRS